MSDRPLLVATGVALTYFDGDIMADAVDDVSLDLPEVGFVGIMGPSGSGKSSLLYLLSALKPATAGSVRFDGLPYERMREEQRARLRRQSFGFVFQQPFLLNYLTARENVLAAAASADRDAGRHADTLLERLGVHHLAHRFPHQASGGERQRICVARAIMNRPRVVFADEPTASLDHVNGHAVMDLLTGYRRTGLVVVVTHDAEMLDGADRVYQMRDGRLQQDGPFEVAGGGPASQGTARSLPDRNAQ